MNINLKAPISTIVAISVGGIILLGYFLPIAPIVTIRSTLLSAAIALAGVALLLGVVNLFYVHLDKIRQGSSTALYSFFLIAALFISLALTIAQRPSGDLPTWLFTYIQVPAETSLMAVLIFSLTFATIRLLHRKPDLFSAAFIISMLLTLAGSGPLFGFDIPLVGDFISPLISRVFVSAGARGILLGVGLGTVATGIRILIGADRPFGG
ncbi:MAG: hypothetical protein IH859_00555 [Chloroflexi bacterium]|nr:hypothetical protein [Chloroflexota bacterium]